MSLKRHKKLATEIFKTLTNLNPKYMQEIFVRNSQNVNGYTYGINSLKNLRPAIWNFIPENVRNVTTLSQFKSVIKTLIKIPFGRFCVVLTIIVLNSVILLFVSFKATLGVPSL